MTSLTILLQFSHDLDFQYDILPFLFLNYTQVLKSIGTETNRPSSAAQCVAFIAVIELPLGSWQEVINILCSNVINNTSSETVKEASLEAIGYICQDIVSMPSVYSRNICMLVAKSSMRRKFKFTKLILNYLT